jgi:hypothetical protein
MPRVQSEEGIRIPRNDVGIRAPIQIKDFPWSWECSEEGGFSALPNAEQGHAGELAQVHVEEWGTLSIHFMQFETYSLKLQGNERYPESAGPGRCGDAV